MPLISRSKSLNDSRTTRQKNRQSADVVRDPRKREKKNDTAAKERLGNYQSVVHLRKQAENQQQRFKLACMFGVRTHTFVPPGQFQGPVANPDPVNPPPEAAASNSSRNSVRSDESDTQTLVPTTINRQEDGEVHSSGAPVSCQENLSDQAQQQPNTDQQMPQRDQRPPSLLEGRSLWHLPSWEEWKRKDQVTQNLMDSYVKDFLAKIEDLEVENSRFKSDFDQQRSSSDTLIKDSTIRSQWVASFPHDTSRGSSSDTLMKHDISPINETSVSGYGSLTSSACSGTGPRRAAGDMGLKYNNTLPMSEVSRVDSVSTLLPVPSLCGDGSRSSTLIRPHSDVQSLHEKLDQLLELEKMKDSDHKKRISELEDRVRELTEERNAVLQRFKKTADENEKLMNRDEHIQEGLRLLLQQHGQNLEQVIKAELHHIQQELQTLGQDVRGQVEAALSFLQASLASPEEGTPKARNPVDHKVRDIVDKIVNLIGPDYRRLGIHLKVPPLELETITNGLEDFATKTHLVLQAWLQKLRDSGDPSCSSAAAQADILTKAFRDIDKDIRLFQNQPISEPERQALWNCLPCAIEHVDNPGVVLDHLIALNEISDAGTNFVLEVINLKEKGRALHRLWHVLEYRGHGIISRLAVALERSDNPHVSRKLTEELGIQNSQAQTHPLSEELTASASSQAAMSLGSRPSHHMSRSTPRSRQQPEPESFETTVISGRGFKKSVRGVEEERDDVWDRRERIFPCSGDAASRRCLTLSAGTRV